MSFRIYDVTRTEPIYDGYKIKINGIEAKPDTARVSAYPFNRRWPGHQRSMDQTELINFLSLETDESLSFEITPPEKCENVVIRPKSLGIEPQIKVDGTIAFTLPKAAYFTVEPYGRKNALHIFTDPKGEYNIAQNDKNVIYYGKGEHDVGMIYLESNQTLFIDEGAVVYACVRAKDAENIRILGRGILDNSQNKEKILYEEKAIGNTSAVKNAVRNHTVQLEYCTGIKIEGITIRDSLVYNIRLRACRDVDISNVKLIGNWRYNSDGIDMHNCEKVNIDNCFIRTFDDCICIKGFDFFYADDEEKAYREAVCHGGRVYDSFHNVRVKNCVLWNDWGRCLEIGAETRAEEICDIVFENCKIIHVTMQPLDCQNVDFAYVHDVTYRDIDVEYDDIIPECILQGSDDMIYEPKDTDYAPAVIDVTVAYHPEYSSKGKRRGRNKNITFENIRLYGRHVPKFHIESYSAEFASTDIFIKNFTQNGFLLSDIRYNFETDNFSKNIIIE